MTDPMDEEFNRIEMESRIKQEYVRDIKIPTREQLMAEVAVLTELVRVLSDRVAQLEKPWVGLTFQEQQEAMLNTNSFHEALIKAEKRLKEKNNG